MDSLNTFALESNKQFKINFAGGDLSSDAGLLLIKEFAAKIGFEDLARKNFKTNDYARFRLHTDPENLLQMIYQTIAAYYRDDDADELTDDPVMTAVLGKETLASQPTLSRFFNQMDEDTLEQMNRIMRIMRRVIYSVNPLESASGSEFHIAWYLWQSGRRSLQLSLSGTRISSADVL